MKDILTLNYLTNEGRVSIDLMILIISCDDREAELFLDSPGRTWEEFVRSEESKFFNQARKTIPPTSELVGISSFSEITVSPEED